MNYMHSIGHDVISISNYKKRKSFHNNNFQLNYSQNIEWDQPMRLLLLLLLIPRGPQNYLGCYNIW